MDADADLGPRRRGSQLESDQYVVKGELEGQVAVCSVLPGSCNSRLLDNATLRARAHARRAREPAGASSSWG